MQHPDKLGKYPITGVIGQGAMGVVYKALDPVIQRPVAIKTIHKALLGDADPVEMAARFRNEAQAVGRLSHPGIVQIYEYGEDETTAYIAMEYVEGRNLEKLLQARPRLPEGDLLSVMDQLLDALDAAHRVGVWHRDVKPANLLVTQGGQVKLTDFGIARIEHLALTQVASMIGTPGYMAPEQYVGEGLSHRVDLFAAGVLLWRLLTGTVPFAGPPQTVMYKILNEQPPAPSTVAGSDPFFDGVVARALAKDPAQRFATAAEFRQALAARSTPRTQISPLTMDEDATIVIPAGGSRGTPRPATGAPTAALSTAAPTAPATAQTAPGSWATGANAAVVAEMERALATVMGPVARAIVKQAARQCHDVESLREAVAQHIDNARDREAFVSGTQRLGTGARTVATSAASAATQVITAVPAAKAAPPAQAADDRLSEAAIAAAAPLVAEVLGPIAKLLVKKAAAQAQTRSQFLQMLVAAAEPGDRARMGKLLSKLPR
jgi:eukaryotic-like serine/threonine-protein kinase